MNKIYKSSKTSAAIVAILFSLIILGALLAGLFSRSNAKNLLEGIGLLIIVFSLIVFGGLLSRVEIDENTKTIVYRQNYIFHRPVSIDKILQIGFPKQNYVVKSLNSFIYIWYDDPDKPGKDQYIKIRDVQFAPRTIATIVTDLRHINPNIKLDQQMAQLVEQNK
jgi:hypothetical protein